MEYVGEPVSDDGVRILVGTDQHIGHKHKDSIRHKDALNSFREFLLIAKRQKVDFVLLGGDLFDVNRPPRRQKYDVTRLLREHVLSDDEVKLEFLSDPSVNFNHSKFPRANYEDPNLNVGLPIFAIHGNHDDMAGGELCALDEYHESGLLNLFGKVNSIDKIELDPILLRKGRTKIALYGLGAQKDEHLNEAFTNGRVTFNRPAEEADSWWNLFVLHQTRTDYSRDNKKFISEKFLPDFLHLSVWGHEHRALSNPGLPAELHEPRYDATYSWMTSQGRRVRQGGPGLRQGGPGLRQGGPGLRQGGPGLRQGGPGLKQGGPGLRQGGPGLRQGGPGLRQGGPGLKQGGPGLRQGGPGLRQGGPGLRRLRGKAETTERGSGRGWVVQPGSSIATSLDRAEAGPKFVSLVEVKGTKWQHHALQLKTVRQFLVLDEDVRMADVREQIRFCPGERFRQQNQERMQDYCGKLIEELVVKAKQEHNKIQPPLPLIRIRVDFAECEPRFNIRTFGTRMFTGRVGNPGELIAPFNSRKDRKKGVVTDGLILEKLSNEREQMSCVEDFVNKYFQEAQEKERRGWEGEEKVEKKGEGEALAVLTPASCSRATTLFVGEEENITSVKAILDCQEAKIITFLAETLDDELDEDDMKIKLDELRELRYTAELKTKEGKEKPNNQAALDASNIANFTLDQLNITDAEMDAAVAGPALTQSRPPLASATDFMEPTATSSRTSTRGGRGRGRGRATPSSSRTQGASNPVLSNPLLASTPRPPATGQADITSFVQPTQPAGSRGRKASGSGSSRAKRSKPAEEDDLPPLRPPSQLKPKNARLRL